MSDPTRDDYLFDPTAPQDPEIARLEARLSGFRYVDPAERGAAEDAGSPAAARADGAARRTPGARRSGGRPATWLRRFVAATLTAAAGYMIVVHWPKERAAEVPPPPVVAAAGFRISTLNGAPSVGDAVVERDGVLSEGALLKTDGRSRARVELANAAKSFGHVDVEPGSELRLLRAQDAEHRFALDRGEIRALTWAPPRLLFIETPSAVAVDLGCAYTLKVDDDGHGMLSVTSGSVAFERDGIEAYVPRGASCPTRVGRGPGTPRFDDASAELKAALERFDFGGGGRAALDEVLRHAGRTRDTLTLFHLLPRTGGEDRREVCDATMKLAPPPDGTGEAAVVRAMRLDEAFLAGWKASLRAYW